MLGLELVGDVLEQAGEVDVVLLVDRPAEDRESRQPDRDGCPVRLGSISARVAQGLADAESQHVEGEIGEILERVHHGSDQVFKHLKITH